MRVLIFDTETTGLDPHINIILQLSYQIVDTESWKTIKDVNYYFSWPKDLSCINPDAIAINGLTEDVLKNKNLTSRKSALKKFIKDMSNVQLLVAHNLEFDKKFILASCSEHCVEVDGYLWNNIFDTMKESVEYCAIPNKNGDGYKWPKLVELADHLQINYSDIKLHDSSDDVELTKRCFMQLLKFRL